MTTMAIAQLPGYFVDILYVLFLFFLSTFNYTRATSLLALQN
jgi:hypothetical protein